MGAATTERFCPQCRGSFVDNSLFCPNDGTPLVAQPLKNFAELGAPDRDVYLGRVLPGDIEIRQLAGVGAMGRVYRAFQRGIERHVAVKILHRELSSNAQIVSRFTREAKVASRLEHPNVVHVYLAGQLPEGELYIVMEFLDGLSLQSALLAAGGRLPLPRAMHVILQLCDAVGEAHSAGVVHRDIKPENIMLVRRGQDPDFIKVLDFGIARINWGDQSMATQQGLIFGTARYISPEGAQGEVVGPEGDVYSIATLLYQLLAGRTPFEGEQAVGVLIQQISDPPPSLLALAPTTPEPVARAIMKNLAKAKTDRDANARAFGRTLIDAAKLGGLSMDDLQTRPSLFGSPAPGPVFPKINRTQEMAMPPELIGMRPPFLPQKTAPVPRQPLPASTSPLQRVSPPAREGSHVDSTLDDANVPPVPPGVNFGGTVLGGAYAPPYVPDEHSAYGPPPEPLEDSDESDFVDDSPADARRKRLRVFVTVIMCFLVGMLGTIGALYKYGMLGTKKTPLPIPTVESNVPEVASVPVDAVASAAPSASAGSDLRIHLSIEFFPVQPNTGDLVTLTGRVSTARPAKRLERATFLITGPGIETGAKLTAVEENGAYRSSFTFVRPGKYDVSFSMIVENFSAKKSVAIAVGGEPTGVLLKPEPKKPGKAAPRPSAPVGTVQWM